MNEIFESAVRSAGDLAGVFEYDGETGYFYLYEVDADSGDKIADVIWIFSGQPDFSQSDVSVRWDSSQRTVGLLIGTVLWAAFDPGSKQKFGVTTDRMVLPTYQMKSSANLLIVSKIGDPS